MSDLRKAIEELADKWQARGEHLKAYSAQFPAEVAETLHDGGADMVHNAAILRALLAANSEPEPKWEWGCGGYRDGEVVQQMFEEDAKSLARAYSVRLWKRTAPGPWIEVGDDE